MEPRDSEHSIDVGARWVVAQQVFDERIDVELGDDDDEQAAGRFVASVLADMGLT